jgi:hypothetical protein
MEGNERGEEGRGWGGLMNIVWKIFLSGRGKTWGYLEG